MEVEVYFCKIYSTTRHCLSSCLQTIQNISIFQEKKKSEKHCLASEIQVFQLLIFNPMKQYKEISGSGVFFLPPHPISSLGWKTLPSKQGLISGEVLPVSKNPGGFCLQRDQSQTQWNVESSPLKSFALSRLPDLPTGPYFKPLKVLDFQWLLELKSEIVTYQNDPQKAGAESFCITNMAYGKYK